MSELSVLDQSPLSRRGRTALVVGVGIGILLLVLAGRRPVGEGEPLDPEGTGRLGAKALVLLLREGGADVRVTARAPDDTRSTMVVLSDTFDRDRRDAVTAWVRAGGVLVVTDPGSPLSLVQPFFSPTGASAAEVVSDPCEAIPALRQIGALDAGGALVYDRDGRLPGAVGCFGDDDGDLIVATPLGAGTVVAVGGAGLFVNARLDHAGNAGLAVALLAARPGTRTQVMSDLAPDAALVTAGEDTASPGGSPLDALPDGVGVAFLQLVVAFAFAILWRARRLGRPVPEVQPVEIPGSELVVAVANLHHKGGHRRGAAAALTGRARRRVSERLGLPASTPGEDLARITAARTGMSPDDALAGMASAPPPDDAALVRVAAAADAVERAVTRPQHHRGDETT